MSEGKEARPLLLLSRRLASAAWLAEMPIAPRERRGGRLKYYYREAA